MADVFARGLVQEQLTAQQILAEHDNYAPDTTVRRFNGTTLGFVTPWNSHGYDVAKVRVLLTSAKSVECLVHSQELASHGHGRSFPPCHADIY